MLSELADAGHKKPKTLSLPPDTQRVCIDLPGETFRCYAHKPKIQVMLRKHRDVIFDIQLFKGMSYTVEAEKSDFYNARDKKLVQVRKKQKASFQDGERLHLWVGRNFEGTLILKSASGTTLGRYEPNALDPARYGEEPGEKPAPLIVTLKNTPDPSPQAIPLATARIQAQSYQCKASTAFECRLWNLSPTARFFGVDAIAPYDRNKPVSAPPEEHPVVAVVDGDGKGMPEKVKNASGESKSGLADVDLNDVVTRNWVLAVLASSAVYIGQNWNWLRHSINRQADGAFRMVSAKVKYAKGKARLYFSGYSKTNPVFQQGGHGSSHPKIMQIYAGVGEAKSLFKSMIGSIKGNAVISFIFGSITSYTEWQADAKNDGYDLAAAWLILLVKVLIAAALAAVLLALILAFLMMVVKVAVATITVGILTIVLSIVGTLLVDFADQYVGKKISGPANTNGLASVVAPWLREVADRLDKVWDYLKEKMPEDYYLKDSSAS